MIPVDETDFVVGHHLEGREAFGWEPLTKQVSNGLITTPREILHLALLGLR